MTAYALVTLNVTDKQTLEAYRARAGEALARYHAEPLAVSPASQVIEGDGPAPDIAVILAFPDRDHALGWINDPAFAEVHALRRASGTSRIVLM